MAKAMAPYHGGYITHMRSEDDSLFEAIDEAFRIGARAACAWTSTTSRRRTGRTGARRRRWSRRSTPRARRGTRRRCDDVPVSVLRQQPRRVLPGLGGREREADGQPQESGDAHAHPARDGRPERRAALPDRGTVGLHGRRLPEAGAREVRGQALERDRDGHGKAVARSRRRSDRQRGPRPVEDQLHDVRGQRADADQVSVGDHRHRRRRRAIRTARRTSCTRARTAPIRASSDATCASSTCSRSRKRCAR